LNLDYVVDKYYEFFRHFQWNIGVVEEPIQAFLEPDLRPSVHWLPSLGRDRFLADPFGLVRDKKVHILCEEFDYRSRKGVISSVEVSADWTASPPLPVISRPVHMSYPYILEYEGGIYCVPETHDAREVRMYRADEFPSRWTPEAVLVRDIPALDGTMFEHGGRWWLACTDFDRGPETHLSLWHAPAPFGPWEPHAGNPVKTDIRSARPAGTPFRVRGDLYRPAQDCSKRYGGRVVINRVVHLTPTEFEEEPVAVVDPFGGGPFPDGIHTLSAVGKFTLVDGYRFRFIPSAFRNAVTRELRARRGAAHSVLRRG